MLLLVLISQGKSWRLLILISLGHNIRYLVFVYLDFVLMSQELTCILYAACRNGTHVHNMLVTCKSSAYSQNVREGVFEVANLILQLLPSKDGIVLRRLLMTAV